MGRTSSKDFMIMTDKEICRDYLQAKDKNYQIQVLADLNITRPEKIKEILIKNGLLDEEIKETKPKTRIKSEPPTDAKNESRGIKAFLKTENPKTGINTEPPTDSETKKPVKTRVSKAKTTKNAINPEPPGDNNITEPFPGFIPEEVYMLVHSRARELKAEAEGYRRKIEACTEEYARLYEFLVAHGREASEKYHIATDNATAAEVTTA